MTMTELQEWNEKIYGPDKEHLQAEWFWSKFKIRSAPIHRDACWSHIPKKWEKPVEIFIEEVQKKYGDKVQFIQIKEKFITFTVYFRAETEEIKKDVDTMIYLTQCELRDRGLHI